MVGINEKCCLGRRRRFFLQVFIFVYDFSYFFIQFDGFSRISVNYLYKFSVFQAHTGKFDLPVETTSAECSRKVILRTKGNRGRNTILRRRRGGNTWSRPTMIPKTLWDLMTVMRLISTIRIWNWIKTTSSKLGCDHRK